MNHRACKSEWLLVPPAAGGSVRREEYFLPTVGPVVAELHRESDALFSALENSKELDRLRGMPQLGIVPSAWHGVRHSRLEYILLTLHITRIAKSETNLSLNSVVTLNDKSQVSSAQELIQCWSILLNVGHLHWTFTAERVLSNELRRRVQVSADALVELLKSVDPSVRDWALAVVDNGQHYKFHQVLAFHRLHKLPSTDEQLRLWRSMIASYVSPDREIPSLMNARALFTKIRRVAFLYLDAEYSPTALSLRLGRVLSSPSELERLLDPDSAAEEDELGSLELFLARRVYLAEEVLEETARVSNGLKRHTRSRLGGAGLRDAVETLARLSSLPGYARADRLAKVVRLEVAPSALILGGMSGRDSLQVDSVVRRASVWSRRHSLSTFVVFESDAQRRISIFQSHADKSDSRSVAGALAHSIDFAGRVLAPTDALLTDDPQFRARLLVTEQTLAARDLAANMIVSSLELFFGVAWRWEWTRAVGGLHAILSTPAVLGDMTEHLLGESSLRPPDALEAIAALRAAEGVRSDIRAVTLSGLRGYANSATRPTIEVDGVAVSHDVTRGEIVVTLVEAKNQRRQSEAKAKADLAIKSAALQRRAHANVSPVRTKRLGAGRALAWRHYRLPYVRPAAPNLNSN